MKLTQTSTSGKWLNYRFSTLKVFILIILGLIILLLKSMGKLLLSSGGEEVSNSPRKFSATLKKASLVTKIKDWYTSLL